MKDITSFQPTLRSTATFQATRRESSRESGSEPLRSFENLDSSKSMEVKLDTPKAGMSPKSMFQSGTSAPLNASILAAIGVQGRQISATEGAGRTVPSPVRVSAQAVVAEAAPAAKFSTMQQNWLDSNPGNYGSLMLHNLSQAVPFAMEPVGIGWANMSTGRSESSNRAVGNVSVEGGKKLAQLLGGTLVDSPFDTFGSSQRDRYIQMPSGQMIEASVLANQLNAAKTSQDPFSATQSVIDVYRNAASNFHLQTSMDAIDLVSKGKLTANRPVGLPS